MYIVFFHCKPPGYSSLAVIWWISFVTSVSMQSEFQINFKCASLTFGHLDTVNRTQSTKQTVTMVIGWRLIFMPRSFEKSRHLRSASAQSREISSRVRPPQTSSQIWGAQVFSSEYFGRKGFSNMTAYLDSACQGCGGNKKSYVSEKFPTSSWPWIYYLLSYMYICFFFVVNILLLYVYRWCINTHIFTKNIVYMISYIFICCLVFTCGCLRCSLQCWVESSWWQIDDDFGGNSPSQKLLFVFCWVCTWKRICWGQGASLLSIRCLWPHGQESERFPYHKKGTIYSLKILGRMNIHNLVTTFFCPRTFMWSLRNPKCEFWSAKTRHGTRKVKVVGSPICIRQHLQFVWSVNIFQFNQTISLRSLEGTQGWLVKSASVPKKSSSKAWDTFSLLELSQVCCVFLCYLLWSHEFCRSEPEEAEDADAGGWGLRVWRCAGSDLRWDTRAG